MRCFVAVLILLLGNHYVLATSNKCRNTDHCSCIKTSEEYEFQCSSSNSDGVVIHATPDKYMKLDCLNEEFNLEILPNYTAGRIELFELRFCPLSQDGFLSVLEKFGIENLENLRLEDVVLRNSSKETAPVTKEFFQGLSSLRNLGISYLSSPLEIDAFDNLPNLTVLYLENNNITNITGMFRNLKLLKILHLSCNSLTDIPNDAFQNLAELQQLHLWKNNLTGITKDYFSGLRNLKSLELSINYIQFIEDDAFSDLPELVDISLRENQLGRISSNVFRRNGKLSSIRMDYSLNVTLDDYAFANLTNLTSVNMEHSGLRNIPAHVFEGSENIRILKMQSNFLQDLPQEVFSGLKHLKELDLTGNHISSINDELFSPLVGLEILKLGGNLISEINGNNFRRTKNLTKLYLNNNRIKTIAKDSFHNHAKLIFMDFSNNLYDMNYEVDGYPFLNCPKLEQLILSRNRIDKFPSEIMLMVHLAKLDLSYNNITSIMVSEFVTLSSKGATINLSNNKISEVNFKLAEVVAIENFKNNTLSVTTVLLNNNRLVCDCLIYDLVRYIKDKLDPTVKTMVDLKLGDDDKCASPEIFQHMIINELQPHHVSCRYPWKCKTSSDCQCFYRPFDKAAVVDCSYKNLSEYPRIEVDSRRMELVEINLTGNMIRRGPNSSLGYDNVTNMFLSNNDIEELTWIPPRTKILKLEGNQLKHLDSKVLKMLNSTSVLTLSGNNWTCDCSAFDFQNFIRDKFAQGSRDILCHDDKKPLIEKKQLCKPISTLIVQTVVPILVFLVFTAIGSTLYFCYQETIKIWAYEQKWLRWLFREEWVDKNKKFDIFLSYSHKDEDFVLQNLLPVLEEGPEPYEVCIHVRNWLGGEFITKQIADSVNDSRRTVVVLSNDFLESVWGKMEFRAAHTKAIKEGRARVIVIKYGELDDEKLDEEMKMYLKTNTYVEWGKPWFWRKLKYALRHSLRHSRSQNKNQKHANMMLKIDDKFELTCPPLSHPESTPPVLGLDPAMLKHSPLSYKRSNKLETPPAETPLVIERD